MAIEASLFTALGEYAAIHDGVEFSIGAKSLRSQLELEISSRFFNESVFHTASPAAITGKSSMTPTAKKLGVAEGLAVVDGRTASAKRMQTPFRSLENAPLQSQSIGVKSQTVTCKGKSAGEPQQGRAPPSARTSKQFSLATAIPRLTPKKIQ